VEQLLTTKLFLPPTRPEIISRPRLIERLHQGTTRQLTLISAPPGFGKSTLISAWASTVEKPVAWLSLDENDNNLKRFLTYLIAAFQVIDGSIGEGILPSLESSENMPMETLVSLLINEISVSDHDFYIVIDDYHLVTTESIYKAIDFLLDHLPPNTHLVMSGRVDPPISISRLRARGQMTEIRLNDLRFTESEVTSLLNDLNRLNLSAEDILALLSRTEGWITGLQLAAISMQGREDIHEFVTAFSGSHHYIIDYLVDEVLARQPEDMQSFLIQTSILERFSSALCDAVLEISNSRECLQELYNANMFLIPLDDEHTWYRYHHLFADFLKQRLREKDPSVIPSLHRRASWWLEQSNLINEAINHSMGGEEYQRAAQLIESIGPDMMMQNEFDQLGKWLDTMPLELVVSWPWLCVIRAWMNHRWARLDESEKYVQYAEKALEDDTIPEHVGGVNVIRGQAAAIRALIAFNKTRIPQAIEFANQALRFLPDGHFNRAAALLALGMAKGVNGEFREANQVLIEAYRDSLGVGNRILAQNVLLEKAGLLVKQGRLYQALETYKESVQFTYSKTEIKIPHASCASISMGDIYREWNELDAALAHVKEGIEIGLQSQMVDAIAMGYAVMARIYLAMEDLESAVEASLIAGRYARELPDLEPITITGILNSEAWVNFSQNKFDEAANLYIENNPCDINDLNCHGEFEQIIWTRILLYRGRANRQLQDLLDAKDLINQMLAMTNDLGLVSKTIELLVLNSLVLTEVGKKDEAVDTLEKALLLAEPGNYIRIFIDEGEPIQELLNQVTANKGLNDYVSRLLAAFNQDAEGNKLAAPQELVEPLSERELEVLKLLSTDLSGPAIARKLMVSINTVRTHTQNIYTKLGVNKRRSAIREAKKLNLI
jgi:LuxR family maltose regulon positive regulatory protein